MYTHRAALATYLNSTTVQAAVDVARQLARIHRKGWFHGYVAGRNVLLRRPFKPVLTDFGTARRKGDVSALIPRCNLYSLLIVNWEQNKTKKFHRHYLLPSMLST